MVGHDPLHSVAFTYPQSILDRPQKTEPGIGFEPIKVSHPSMTVPWLPWYSFSPRLIALSRIELESLAYEASDLTISATELLSGARGNRTPLLPCKGSVHPLYFAPLLSFSSGGGI